MTQTTFSIAAADQDGYFYYGKASYPPDGSGPIGGTNPIYVGRELQAGTFYTEVGLLRFDTSSLPDNATVTAATLRFWITALANADSRNITADWYTYAGGTPGSGDFADTGVNAHGATALSALTNGADNDLTLINLSNVNLTGITGIRLHVDGGQPTGSNLVTIASYEAAQTEARLIVTYTLPGGSDANKGRIPRRRTLQRM